MDDDSEIKGVRGVSLRVNFLPCPVLRSLLHISMNSSIRFIEDIGTDGSLR